MYLLRMLQQVVLYDQKHSQQIIEFTPIKMTIWWQKETRKFMQLSSA